MSASTTTSGAYLFLGQTPISWGTLDKLGLHESWTQTSRVQNGSLWIFFDNLIDYELHRFQEETLAPSLTNITLWPLRGGQFDKLSHGLNTNHSQHRDHVGATELK
jgi:hypothetical protein